MKNLDDFIKEVKAQSEKEKLNSDDTPTGRCKITTVFGTTCTDGLTLNGCNRVAVRVGGTADWTEGAKCP